MPDKKQIYKCDACGIIVEVLHGGESALVCCGADMNLFQEKASDDGKEKHVPVFEIMGNDIKVKVGSKPHPMEDNHYIEWIEIIDKDKTYRHYLSPGQRPETIFKSHDHGIKAREYCSVHGLWASG